jgi:hypothetical protein
MIIINCENSKSVKVIVSEHVAYALVVEHLVDVSVSPFLEPEERL